MTATVNNLNLYLFKTDSWVVGPLKTVDSQEDYESQTTYKVLVFINKIDYEFAATLKGFKKHKPFTLLIRIARHSPDYMLVNLSREQVKKCNVKFAIKKLLS